MPDCNIIHPHGGYHFISIVTNALTRIFQTDIFRRQQGLKWVTQVNNAWELAISYIYFIPFSFRPLVSQAIGL